MHSSAFWVLDCIAALASTGVPCFELLLVRDEATAGLGTGGVMGWVGIFPVECLRIRCFHAVWSPTSRYMGVCARACVWGGWEGYFRGLMVAQCRVQLPVLTSTPSPTLRFRQQLPPCLGKVKRAERPALPPSIAPLQGP